MNKYIEYDIEQGLKYLKVGIMNALVDIESGEEDKIYLKGPIALSLIIKCAEERGWETDPNMDWDWTNSWEVDYFYYMITPNKQRVGIYGSLLNNDRVQLRIDYGYEN